MSDGSGQAATPEGPARARCRRGPTIARRWRGPARARCRRGQASARRQRVGWLGERLGGSFRIGLGSSFNYMGMSRGVEMETTKPAATAYLRKWHWKLELAKSDGSCAMVPFDSLEMGTRSKKTNPTSPAMSTRSKRRLSL
ncbi:uncharacterized protein LOC123404651 [Hordeum vulgare subsp. vulgare]|uniref:uncharacterized protein LOC123404651 n=1 Tax=Hordeum vulgare subsp. vulgare TaxID=112509 RepID=UPI001D1A4610|nr:uncharacterized protein LOC123404651 [Hordeum vulgare subsp. vulgare]